MTRLNHTTIETRCLKNVIFFQTILSIALSRKINNDDWSSSETAREF